MKVLVVIALIVCAYLVYDAARFALLVRKSSAVVAQSAPFEREIGKRSILVLGDSTAASVGSAPDESVPGRLAKYLDASVENYAKSGARVADLAGQLSRAKQTSYDVVLIQIGANDVMRFTDWSTFEANLDSVLKKAREKSSRVLLLTAGKIGDAPIFPWFVRSMLNARTADARERAMRIAEKHGAVYVDIYARESPFEADIQRYYSVDLLHPSGDGYAFWFSIVREYVEKEWPELTK